MVVVGESSNADVRTMAEALAIVRDGGEIRVLPGQYRETVRITKPVTVTADGDVPPVFDNLIVNVVGTVRLERIRIEANGAPSALSVQAGDVKLIACAVLNRGAARGGRQMTSAIIAAGGHLEINGGVIGPGGDAAIIAAGASRVFVRRAIINGDTGYGLYATDQAWATVSGGTRISRLSGGVAINADERSSINLSRSIVAGPPSQPAISVAGEAEAEILGNQVSIAVDGRLVDRTDRNWVLVAPTAQATFSGNRSGRHRLRSSVPQRLR